MRARRSMLIAGGLLVAASGADGQSAPDTVLAASVEAGGGVITGGPHAAFVTLAAIEGVPVSRGGPYEASGGLVRRRADERPPPIFADDFE